MIFSIIVLYFAKYVIKRLKTWDIKTIRTSYKDILMQVTAPNINVLAAATAAAKPVKSMSVAVAVSATASKRFLSLGF